MDEPGLQNVRNPASAACRQGPNFVGRKGSGEKKKGKKKKREKKKKGKKKKEERKRESKKRKRKAKINLPETFLIQLVKNN